MSVNVICGPDGVGKTTLAKNVVEKLSQTEDAQYMYGGKKSNHYLITTTITHAILKGIRKIPVLRRLSRFYQATVFYPFEYLENWARYLVAKHNSGKGKIIFIDRFVVDRMWRSQLTKSDESKVKKRIEDKFYANLYKHLFPSIDSYIFLLPDASVIHRRAPTEYNSFEHCVIIRNAYESLANNMSSLGYNTYIIDETAEPESLVTILLKKLEH